MTNNTMGGNATDGTYRVQSYDTWECSNCGDQYRGTEESPAKACSYCRENAGWIRTWKVSCLECHSVFFAPEKQDAIQKAKECDCEVPWKQDTVTEQ